MREAEARRGSNFLEAAGDEETSGLKAGGEGAGGKEVGGKGAGNEEVSGFPADFAITLSRCSARSDKECFGTYFLKLY